MLAYYMYDAVKIKAAELTSTPCIINSLFRP